VRAVRWLRVLGGERAVNALIEALEHPSVDVRWRAVDALGRMKAQEAVPALVRRFQRELPGPERANCVKALAQIGDPSAVPPLIAALNSGSEWVAEEACRALASFGDRRAIGPVLQTLSHPDWSVRFRACETLIELEATDKRLDVVLGQLARERESEEYRQRIKEMQRELARQRGADDAEEEAPPSEQEQRRAVETAIKDLRDPDPRIRAEAVRRLREPEEPEAVAALVAALEDSDPHVRRGAALRLSGSGVAQALPALIEHLRADSSPGVRMMCVVFLHQFADDQVVEALRQALADPQWEVVTAASVGLGKRGDRRAIPWLLPLRDHSDRRIRYYAARALLRLKTGDQRLVAGLEQLSRDPEADEHDLRAAERNSRLEDMRRMRGREAGDREPQWHLTMAEMVEQARRLLAQEDS
jgi:HEAT repeat protein